MQGLGGGLGARRQWLGLPSSVRAHKQHLLASPDLEHRYGATSSSIQHPSSLYRHMHLGFDSCS